MTTGDENERANALVERLRRQQDVDETALAAVRNVPRHEFVPESRQSAAYEDRPLPIDEGQTISAPHMVAVMVDLLSLSSGENVLEIGTGCGYHAAVTAEVVGPGNVYSVEYHDALAARARETLQSLNYGDVSIRVGDGHDGWPDNAPYDAAYLTCAADDFPTDVVAQVRPGGRILAPIESNGRFGRAQRLVLAVKRADGSLDRDDRGAVRFVPMRGG